jgi:hypothetical protein
MATKKTPSKKTAAPAKKTAAKKTAATAAKKPAKKPAKKAAVKKTAAKKQSPKKATGTSTHEDAHVAENLWNVFQNATTSTTEVSATVNGKVIYANDVKPAALRKRFLSWFKR